MLGPLRSDTLSSVKFLKKAISEGIGPLIKVPCISILLTRCQFFMKLGILPEILLPSIRRSVIFVSLEKVEGNSQSLQTDDVTQFWWNRALELVGF